MFYSGGGVPAEKRGGGGGCRRGIRVALAEMPATRSKASGALETGEGELVPPPRRPHPPWRYPHGPVHGEILEKSRARWPAGCTPGTAAPLISPRTATAPGRGRGRSAEGAGGAGAAGRSVWVLPRKSRRSKGASELHRYPPAKARAGCGLLARYPGILLRRHGWGGAAGKERMDIPSRTRRRRRQYSSLGTGPNVFWNSWQHYRV